MPFSTSRRRQIHQGFDKLQAHSGHSLFSWVVLCFAYYQVAITANGTVGLRVISLVFLQAISRATIVVGFGSWLIKSTPRRRLGVKAVEVVKAFGRLGWMCERRALS